MNIAALRAGTLASARHQAHLMLLAAWLSLAAGCASAHRGAVADARPAVDSLAAKQNRPAAPAAKSTQKNVARRKDPKKDIQPVSAEKRLPATEECPTFDCLREDSDCEARAAYPDEYICDGGDRETPVHYDHDAVRGLDSEDTVIEFHDEQGKRKVKASTQSCIYAPRFASVAVANGANEDSTGDHAALHRHEARQAGLHNPQRGVAAKVAELAEPLVTRERGSSLLNEEASADVDQSRRLSAHEHAAVALANYGFLESGVVRQSDEPWLATTIQAAAVWSKDQYPVIAAKSEAPQTVEATFDADELVGEEPRFTAKGQLRVVKMADKQVAAAGEVVTFTIRFDNLGARPLYSVVLSDNLTPRLEYVEDSATCDREGQLVVDDNGEGSVILRWELADPLPGRAGGVVSFQARVR
jgi:uncharacterized repeat protein (TIGR01451 family)